MNLKFLVLFILLFCGCLCGINPNQTYCIYNVTDSHGKTYTNLIRCGVGDNEYIDQKGRRYTFHGNYTVISSTISGREILRLRTERE